MTHRKLLLEDRCVDKITESSTMNLRYVKNFEFLKLQNRLSKPQGITAIKDSSTEKCYIRLPVQNKHLTRQKVFQYQIISNQVVQ